MTKINIFTEGGEDIGLGHLTRCIAFSQAIKEIDADIKIKFIISGDNSAIEFLKDYDIYFINFDWQKQDDKILDLVRNNDLVVIDSYLANESVYDKISTVLYKRFNLNSSILNPLVMIDDYNRIEYPAGIVVNPSIYGDKLNYPQKGDVIYLLGKDYIILRKEFWDVPIKKINKKVKNILITFGGINHSALIYKIINYLRNKFDFNFYLVGSKNRVDAKEIFNLMLKADICISGGGQATYELARIGVPTIGICFAENQRLNLEGWQKAGFIEYVGWYKDENILDRLIDSINKLIPYQERIKRNKIGRSYIDGKGVNRIVEIVLNKEVKKIKLRSATEENSVDIWKWRNHFKIRRWCFNTNKIDYSSHRKWFFNKLRDKNTRIYIAKQNKNKIGVIRFDIGKKSVTVNISLNPYFLGKGLGSKIIRYGTEKFIREVGNDKPIIAEIKKDNIVAQKAFLKAGYNNFYKKKKENKNLIAVGFYFQNKHEK